MTQLALQIPVDGQPFATEGPKVGTSLTSIQTVVNGGLDTGNLASGAGIVGTQLASATVADDRLASPNNATYKQIVPSLGLTNVPGTSIMTSGNTYLFWESQSTQIPQTAGLAYAGMSVFYLDPAWYTAGSKTNKYNLRVSLLTNATAPTSTFTVGLYPVTAVAGAAWTNSITLGAVTAGSTVAFAAPTASTASQGSSGDFTAPAAGFYAVACAITVASMVSNSSVAVRAILQQRQV